MYDEGIALLHDLPFVEDPRYPRRLVIAHQNRGLALQTQGDAGVGAAVMAFTNALGVLGSEHASAIPDRNHLEAVVCVNLASAHAARATDGSSAQAREAASRAISIVKEAEQQDEHAAEVGLKARHVLCHAMARHLSATSDGRTMTMSTRRLTSWTRGWVWSAGGSRRASPAFRAIAYDLFRFGARVYAIYQPQFLDEFVRDNLDPSLSSADYVGSDEMLNAARGAGPQSAASS